MRQAAAALELLPGQRESLEVIARSSSAQHREVQRARALLLATDGVANTVIATAVSATPKTVRAWRDRFAEDGLARLGQVRPGRGRKPSIPQGTIDEVVELTLHSKPDGETHWSCRTMAERVGISSSEVQRIWAARGLKPHLVDTFKLSNDPAFETKLTDVVGLYLNPPEQAIVVCIDEKSQIQALDRTLPSLPIKKGRAATMTHDYKRNGSTTLFAALEVATGQVIGECLPRHRASEFVKFLNTVETAVPQSLDVHVILDNYATHKHAIVTRWLAAHPRVHFHFTPTSSSWLNLVARWFRELTEKALRRGVFPSVPDLIAAIEDYLATHNDNPRPLTWTASVESILAKVARGRVALKQENVSGKDH
jgi:transposase